MFEFEELVRLVVDIIILIAKKRLKSSLKEKKSTYCSFLYDPGDRIGHAWKSKDDTFIPLFMINSFIYIHVVSQTLIIQFIRFSLSFYIYIYIY